MYNFSLENENVTSGAVLGLTEYVSSTLNKARMDINKYEGNEKEEISVVFDLANNMFYSYNT